MHVLVHVQCLEVYEDFPAISLIIYYIKKYSSIICFGFLA